MSYFSDKLTVVNNADPKAEFLRTLTPDQAKMYTKLFAREAGSSAIAGEAKSRAIAGEAKSHAIAGEAKSRAIAGEAKSRASATEADQDIEDFKEAINQAEIQLSRMRSLKEGKEAEHRQAIEAIQSEIERCEEKHKEYSKEALQAHFDAIAQEKSEAVNKQIADLEKQIAALKARFDCEMDELGRQFNDAEVNLVNADQSIREEQDALFRESQTMGTLFRKEIADIDDEIQQHDAELQLMKKQLADMIREKNKRISSVSVFTAQHFTRERRKVQDDAVSRFVSPRSFSRPKPEASSAAPARPVQVTDGDASGVAARNISRPIPVAAPEEKSTTFSQKPSKLAETPLANPFQVAQASAEKASSESAQTVKPLKASRLSLYSGNKPAVSSKGGKALPPRPPRTPAQIASAAKASKRANADKTTKRANAAKTTSRKPTTVTRTETSPSKSTGALQQSKLAQNTQPTRVASKVQAASSRGLYDEDAREILKLIKASLASNNGSYSKLVKSIGNAKQLSKNSNFTNALFIRWKHQKEIGYPSPAISSAVADAVFKLFN